MSRKLFKSHSHKRPEKSAISVTAERDFEREVRKIEQLDDCSRKLYRDMKRCSESMAGQSKCELKLVQDLAGSMLVQNDRQLSQVVEPWIHAVRRLDHLTQEINMCSQKTVTEPMKKFGSIFPSVQAATKKREQSLQEYNKCQLKLDKYLERERTGANIVKQETSRKALIVAKEDFETQNRLLMEDMPKLYEGRIDYFQPSFLALIKAQIKFYTDAVKIYSDLVDQIKSDPEDTDDSAYDQKLQQKLADIKALSIVVDD